MYTITLRFWLVFVLTICVLCAVGCGGSFEYNDEPLPDSRAAIPAAPSASSSI